MLACPLRRLSQQRPVLNLLGSVRFCYFAADRRVAAAGHGPDRPAGKLLAGLDQRRPHVVHLRAPPDALAKLAWALADEAVRPTPVVRRVRHRSCVPLPHVPKDAPACMQPLLSWLSEKIS